MECNLINIGHLSKSSWLSFFLNLNTTQWKSDTCPNPLGYLSSFNGIQPNRKKKPVQILLATFLLQLAYNPTIIGHLYKCSWPPFFLNWHTTQKELDTCPNPPGYLSSFTGIQPNKSRTLVQILLVTSSFTGIQPNKSWTPV